MNKIRGQPIHEFYCLVYLFLMELTDIEVFKRQLLSVYSKISKLKPAERKQVTAKQKQKIWIFNIE